MRRVAKPLALAFILPVLMATLLAACSMTEQDSLTTGDTPTPAANPSSMSTAPNPGLSAPATPEPTVSPAPIPTESPRALPVQPSSRYASAGPAGDFYLAADLVSVSSGYAHTCGLRSDGTAVCWGRDWEGQSSEPGGTFAAISAFRHHSCGARTQGGVECWGQAPSPVPDRFTETGETYTSLSSGADHVCVLLGDGRADCWANSYGAQHGLDRAPAGAFLSVEAGYGHMCGIRTNGSVICWGGGYGEGVSVLPDETFVSITAARESYSCGIRTDGTVACWSYRDREFSDEIAPAGTFSSIDAGRREACGIRTDGTVRCWGEELAPAGVLSFGMPPDGSYSAIAVGDEQACASRTDGTTVCWGRTPGAMPPGGYGIDELGEVYAVYAVRDAGIVTYIAVGESNSCQWQMAPQEAHKFCWGNPDAEVPESGGPTYRSVSAGDLYTCAVSTDGEAVCWGSSQSPEGSLWGGSPSGTRMPPDLRRRANNPPEGEFLDIAAGRFHACGLRAGGSVVCWGSSGKGQATSPGGEFAAISAGEYHTCGLRPGGAAVCWGEIYYRGVSSGAPEGAFASIASGHNSSCGIRADGSVECWGGGKPSPPGEFISYDIGAHDACGITVSLEVVCQSVFGSVSTLSWTGPMTALSMGVTHGCGIRPDGSLVCWYGNHGLNCAARRHIRSGQRRPGLHLRRANQRDRRLLGNEGGIRADHSPGDTRQESFGLLQGNRWPNGTHSHRQARPGDAPSLSPSRLGGHDGPGSRDMRSTVLRRVLAGRCQHCIRTEAVGRRCGRKRAGQLGGYAFASGNLPRSRPRNRQIAAGTWRRCGCEE